MFRTLDLHNLDPLGCLCVIVLIYIILQHFPTHLSFGFIFVSNAECGTVWHNKEPKLKKTHKEAEQPWRGSAPLLTLSLPAQLSAQWHPSEAPGSTTPAESKRWRAWRRSECPLSSPSAAPPQPGAAGEGRRSREEVGGAERRRRRRGEEEKQFGGAVRSRERKRKWWSPDPRPYQRQAPHQGSQQHQQVTLVLFLLNQEVKNLHWSTESQGQSQELKQRSDVRGQSQELKQRLEPEAETEVRGQSQELKKSWRLEVRASSLKQRSKPEAETEVKSGSHRLAAAELGQGDGATWWVELQVQQVKRWDGPQVQAGEPEQQSVLEALSEVGSGCEPCHVPVLRIKQQVSCQQQQQQQIQQQI